MDLQKCCACGDAGPSSAHTEQKERRDAHRAAQAHTLKRAREEERTDLSLISRMRMYSGIMDIIAEQFKKGVCVCYEGPHLHYTEAFRKYTPGDRGIPDCPEPPLPFQSEVKAAAWIAWDKEWREARREYDRTQKWPRSFYSWEKPEQQWSQTKWNPPQEP